MYQVPPTGEPTNNSGSSLVQLTLGGVIDTSGFGFTVTVVSAESIQPVAKVTTTLCGPAVVTSSV